MDDEAQFANAIVYGSVACAWFVSPPEAETIVDGASVFVMV